MTFIEILRGGSLTENEKSKVLQDLRGEDSPTTTTNDQTTTKTTTTGDQTTATTTSTRTTASGSIVTVSFTTDGPVEVEVEQLGKKETKIGLVICYEKSRLFGKGSKAVMSYKDNPLWNRSAFF